VAPAPGNPGSGGRVQRRVHRNQPAQAFGADQLAEVVLRTDEGTKLDAAIKGSRVAFKVDGTDHATHTGWSVVVRGEAVEVTDPAGLARLRKLPLHPWAPGAKAHYVRILPAVLTGRWITASRQEAESARRGQRPGRSPSP
jgi:nitroimidazol reductase NimA-like FMN-containing flavoprotein (pyridoxamine 5'-phosphate oxidase superfamily)